ncbi:MAG: hypothetical protein ACKOC4_02870 [Planctomycetia bacterium]
MPSTEACLIVACAAAAVAGACATAGAWLVRGSTAVPAAAWAVAAAAVLTGEMAARAAGGLADPASAAAVRLVAGALSLCPVMALLGAKRPQHGVWQFIVATLAVVLALPAVSAVLIRPGTPPAVHPLGRWFLLLLVLVGWLNFAATRHGLAAAAVAAGQIVLLREFLPLVPFARAPAAAVDAAGCLAVALGAGMAAGHSAFAGLRRGAAGATGPQGRHPLAARIDPPFLALRETLGAAWTLRIAERFDAVAAARGWPCRLRFGGLEVRGAGGAGPWQREAARAFRALARRFVSHGWLRRHGWY